MENPPAPSPFPLMAEEIEKSLGPQTFIKKVFSFDTIDSTNTYARALFEQGITGPLLVIADEQTRGRGRFDRTWYSGKGKNLTFSLLFQPQIPHSRLGILPLCIAECVAKAVESLVNVSIETKWPNDLLIRGKKVCGILMESVLIGQKIEAIIIGIGLNVNQTRFLPELHATSLWLSAKRPLDRLQMLGAIVRNLQWLCEPFADSVPDTMLVGWKRRCRMFGRTIHVQSGSDTLTGIARDVADDGGLLIEIAGVEQKVFAGDVTVVEI